MKCVAEQYNATVVLEIPSRRTPMYFPAKRALFGNNKLVGESPRQQMSVHMKLSKQLKTFGTVSLIFLSGAHLHCKKPPPPVPSDPYMVKRWTQAKAINVSDHSLTEWDSTFLVLGITSLTASKSQWTSIRERTPDALMASDIDLKIYMAIDSSYWYIAVAGSDDRVLHSPPPYNYSGDCLEVFFAGKDLGSPNGMDALVQHPTKGSLTPQAAFFQLVLSAAPLQNKEDYFAKFRTDLAFRDDAIRSGFIANVWPTNSGWNAEVRIPLASFEPQVRNEINVHRRLKMNIDYLDYDIRLAERTLKDNWGFYPDNVFCLDAEERQVNVPKFMREVVFE